MIVDYTINRNSNDFPAIPTDNRELNRYLQRVSIKGFNKKVEVRETVLGRGKCLTGCYWHVSGKIMVSSMIDTRLMFLDTAIHELSHGYGVQYDLSYNHDVMFHQIYRAAIANMGLADILESSTYGERIK